MDHLPPAPTPPVNNNNSGNMASNSDRTANLLNLLKFSSSNAAQQRQQALPPQQAQQHQQHQQQLHHEQQHEQHQPVREMEHQQYHQAEQQMHSPPQHQPQQYHSPPASVPQHQFPSPRIHQPAPTSADPSGLLAALMRGAHDSESPAPRPEQQQQQQQHSQHPQHHHLHEQPQSQHQPSTFGNGSPPPDTRSYLLNLLNRPKPGQSEQPSMMTETSRSNNDTPQSPELREHAREFLSQYQQPTDAYTAAKQYQASKAHENGHVHASQGNAESYSHGSSHQQPTQQGGSQDVDALYRLIGTLAHQTSSPQGSNAHSSNTGPQALKKDHPSPAGSQHHGSQRGSYHSPITSPHDLHRHKVNRTSSLHSHQSASHHSVSKPTPTSTEYDRYAGSEHNKETVSDAVSDLAGRADHDAREALDRAEQEQTQAEIAEELDQMLNADSDREFHRSARAAAKDLQKELDRSDNEGALEETLPAEIAEAVHDIVDEVANQDVADSWESADQDEIVVIEEQEGPPVKVFNFPMKPWISINLQEGTTDPRPEFRDEAIMTLLA